MIAVAALAEMEDPSAQEPLNALLNALPTNFGEVPLEGMVAFVIRETWLRTFLRGHARAALMRLGDKDQAAQLISLVNKTVASQSFLFTSGTFSKTNYSIDVPPNPALAADLIRVGGAVDNEEWIRALNRWLHRPELADPAREILAKHKSASA
jgi:hypothetical protein